MDSIVFHLDSQELDLAFVKSLKSLFKGQKLTITVTPEAKEITNPDLLAKLARNEQSTVEYTIPAKDFTTLANRFLENNDFDVVEAIKSYKKV